ncbi:unnamed protein product, partial [Musa textilis]
LRLVVIRFLTHIRALPWFGPLPPWRTMMRRLADSFGFTNSINCVSSSEIAAYHLIS